MRKLGKKINGNLAIYYGIGSSLTAVGALVGTIVMLIKKLIGSTDLTWWALLMMLIIGIVLGFIGYSLLRVGNEELED